MLTANTMFHVELRKVLAEEVERLKENLASGQSLDAYKNITGQIAAYRRTIDNFCPEIETLISQR